MVRRSCETRTRFSLAARSRISGSPMPSNSASAADAKSIVGSRWRTALTISKLRSASAWKRMLKRGTHPTWLGSLDLLPKRWIRLFERNPTGLEFALGLFKVFVDLSLVIEIESDCAVDSGKLLEERELLQDSLLRVSTIEGINHRIQRYARRGHIVALVALFDVL